MRYLLFLSMMALGLTASAQAFLPGKLVTANGDTLVGLVAEQGGITYSYKATKNSNERIFQRKEIVAYERNDIKYEEHEIEVLRGKFPERVKDFLSVVEEGQVRLLKYEGTGLFGSSHVGYYLHEKGMHMPLRVNMSPSNFKVQMRQYFSDYPELADRIKHKELTYEKTQEIVQLYNSWYKTQPHENETTVEEPAAKPEKPKKVKNQGAEKEEEDPLRDKGEQSDEN